MELVDTASADTRGGYSTRPEGRSMLVVKVICAAALPFGGASSTTFIRDSLGGIVSQKVRRSWNPGYLSRARRSLLEMGDQKTGLQLSAILLHSCSQEIHCYSKGGSSKKKDLKQGRRGAGGWGEGAHSFCCLSQSVDHRPRLLFRDGAPRFYS